jgi:hypothetical protein
MVVELVSLAEGTTKPSFLHVVKDLEDMLTSSDLLGHIASQVRHQPLACIVRRQAAGLMA